MELLERFHKEIVLEANFLLKMKKIKNITRDKDMNPLLMDSLPNHDIWVKGWTGSNKWLNYGIVYDSKYYNSHTFTHDLIKYIEKFEERPVLMAGFSLLKSGGKIPKHTDEQVLHEKENVWHYGLDVPENCYLIIDNKKITEENGKLIKFDDAMIHSAVNNSNNDRMILYIKFKF